MKPTPPPPARNNSHKPGHAPGRAPSLSQQVVDSVAERIRSGALKPGERVPTEPLLMQEHGVSRSVVREAVSRLQASGLVRTHQGVGSFVLASRPTKPLLQTPSAALKLQQKLAMLELRLSLESEAAALAALRRTPPQLAAMARALDDFDTRHNTGTGADAGTAEADFRFHELLAQATGNEYFVQVLRTLGSATIPRQAARTAQATRGARDATKTPRFGEPSPQLRHGKNITAQEHRAVLDAIARGDAQMARAAMFMHLNNSRERMKNVSR